MRVIYQWDKSFRSGGAKQYMGLQRNSNGTGFRLLVKGDKSHYCRLCKLTVKDYPHYHTQNDYVTIT